MERNCEMVITPMFEKVKVDSKCEAEIKYHAAHGINGISEIEYPNGADGPMILSEIDKDEYDYLEYLPIIRFSKRFCGKEVLIKYDVERFISNMLISLNEDNYVKNLSNFKNKDYSFISFNKYGGIKASKFDNIFNSFRNKPGGGLWASMYTPEKQYISAWQLYISSHRKEGWTQKRASTHAVLFNLKDDSKIPVIDSWEDYKKLVDTFSYKAVFKENGKPLPDDIPGDLIDYRLMSMCYDGIYVTKNGILDAGDTYWCNDWWNMVKRHEKDTNLVSFGCESLCLFNLDCIENRSYIKLEKW